MIRTYTYRIIPVIRMATKKRGGPCAPQLIEQELLGLSCLFVLFCFSDLALCKAAFSQLLKIIAPPTRI